MNQTFVQPHKVVPTSAIPANVGFVKPISLFNPDGSPISLDPQTGANLPFTAVVTGSAIGTVGKITSAAEPTTNTMVVIKFTNGNSANTPTLAFNGGSARAFQLAGVASASAKMTIAAGGVGLFFFDGTILHQVGVLS